MQYMQFFILYILYSVLGNPYYRNNTVLATSAENFDLSYSEIIKVHLIPIYL